MASGTNKNKGQGGRSGSEARKGGKRRAGRTLDQSERVVGSDETVFSLESNGNSRHASVGIGAFLVLLEGDALGVDGGHVDGKGRGLVVKVVVK